MPTKAAPTKLFVFVFRAAVPGNSRESTPGVGATSPTQLAAVAQLLSTRLPPSQTRVAGARRSSNDSSRGRKGGRRVGFGRERAAPPFRFRPEDENNTARDLLWESGRRYNGRVIAAGAQTGPRGGAGPVRGLLGGSASPAAFVFRVRNRESGLRSVGPFCVSPDSW